MIQNRREFCMSLAALGLSGTFSSSPDTSITSATEYVSKIATPALYARTVTQGKWKLSRHLSVLDRKLTDLAARRIRRLIVTMPPRHGKSELCTKFCPSWYLGLFPQDRVILTSYEASFAAKWGGRVRDLVERYGHELFGIHLTGDTKAKDRWEIQGGDALQTGGMITAGIGGPILGEGGNLMIIDDPIKNAEEAVSQTIRDKHWDWYQSTFLSRLEPDGVQLITMQRWHDDDLVGRILRHAEESGEEWEVVNMPAVAEEDEYIDGELFRTAGQVLWPERWGTRWYEQRQKQVDIYWWLAQYQQRPGQFGKCEWPAEYFTDDIWFDEWPRQPVCKVLSLDPSKGKDVKKGDYSAIVRASLDGQGTIYVDADLERRPVERIIQDSVRHYLEFMPNGFIVEINQFQELLAGNIKEAFGARHFQPAIYGVTNTGNKQNRILNVGPHLGRFGLKIKRGNQLLLQQLKEFPLGKHDDGPDALEMAIRLIEHLMTGGPSDGLGSHLVRVD